jgi:hypothetical protein
VTQAIRQVGETRYILLLTKNNAALNIIQEQVCAGLHVVLLLLDRPFFLIILFLSTNLLTGMTGISLHVQWPLTDKKVATTLTGLC